MSSYVFLLLSLSQNELIEMAFVAPDLEDDFARAKDTEIDDELEITKQKQKELQNGRRHACKHTRSSALLLSC